MYANISSKFNTNTAKLLYNGEPNVKGAILDLKIFKHINWLECTNSNLGSIININKNVIYIRCDLNNITGFDNLPDKLNTLICSNNKITNLDNLPEKLKKLICSNNKITNLDNLPHNLEYLDCIHNNIQKIDNLPWNIKELVIELNNHYSLDYLPESLRVLTLHNKYITCVNREINLENLPVLLEIIHFDIDEKPKIIGNTTNWVIKKDRIIRKKYAEIHEQPKTFSPTSIDYLDCKNDYNEDEYRWLSYSYSYDSD